jgi:peptidoglycan hydrolase CwlO-like protein
MTTQITKQSTILAELKGFKGQIDNLKMDVNDHERRLTHLNSELHKQDALLMGYKTTNDRIVASLRTDVNDTCAKIPELR